MSDHSDLCEFSELHTWRRWTVEVVGGRSNGRLELAVVSQVLQRQAIQCFVYENCQLEFNALQLCQWCKLVFAFTESLLYSFSTLLKRRQAYTDSPRCVAYSAHTARVSVSAHCTYVVIRVFTDQVSCSERAV